MGSAWRRKSRDRRPTTSSAQLVEQAQGLSVESRRLLEVASVQSAEVADVLLTLAGEASVGPLRARGLVAESDLGTKMTADGDETVAALRMMEDDPRTAMTPVAVLAEELQDAVRRLEDPVPPTSQPGSRTDVPGTEPRVNETGLEAQVRRIELSNRPFDGDLGL